MMAPRVKGRSEGEEASLAPLASFMMSLSLIEYSSFPGQTLSPIPHPLILIPLFHLVPILLLSLLSSLDIELVLIISSESFEALSRRSLVTVAVSVSHQQVNENEKAKTLGQLVLPRHSRFLCKNLDPGGLSWVSTLAHLCFSPFTGLTVFCACQSNEALVSENG